MSIKGTKTEQNLLKSFAGESQARNRYDYFAKQAKKEGYEKVRLIFEETALQEKEHAKRFFKFLEGGGLEITATYPAGKIGTTAENLKASAMGENEEHTEIYPEFARIAEEEGFSEIALLWKNVSIAEKHHEERYASLLAEVEAGTAFKNSDKTTWRCLNCGFVHDGTEAPGKCPACDHPQAWFEELGKHW
ncbi:MAG: rubrerythrin family protein [bacterium]|nr:rubrerythrin family protein [bacterium]